MLKSIFIFRSLTPNIYQRCILLQFYFLLLEYQQQTHLLNMATIVMPGDLKIKVARWLGKIFIWIQILLHFKKKCISCIIFVGFWPNNKYEKLFTNYCKWNFEKRKKKITTLLLWYQGYRGTSTEYFEIGSWKLNMWLLIHPCAGAKSSTYFCYISHVKNISIK